VPSPQIKLVSVLSQVYITFIKASITFQMQVESTDVTGHSGSNRQAVQLK